MCNNTFLAGTLHLRVTGIVSPISVYVAVSLWKRSAIFLCLSHPIYKAFGLSVSQLRTWTDEGVSGWLASLAHQALDASSTPYT